MSNQHAECLRNAASEIESVDTVETAIIGVTMRNAADEIDRLCDDSSIHWRQIDLARIKELESRLGQLQLELDAAKRERYTVWESAALGALFEALTEQAPCKVWIHFRGYGTAKKGQNPPKLFDSAVG